MSTLYATFKYVVLTTILLASSGHAQAATLDWFGGSDFGDTFAWHEGGVPVMAVPIVGDTARFDAVVPGGFVPVISSHTLDAILIDDVIGFGITVFDMSPGTTFNLVGTASTASLELYGEAEFDFGTINAAQGVLVGTSPATQTSLLELRHGAHLDSSQTTVAEGTAAFVNSMTLFGSSADLGVANIHGNFFADDSQVTSSFFTLSGGFPANADFSGGSTWVGTGPTIIGDQSNATLDVLGASTITLDALDVGVGPNSVADVSIANLGFGEERTEVTANAMRIGVASGDTDFIVNFGSRASAPTITAGVAAGSVSRIELAGRQTINVGGQMVELPATLEATTELVVGVEGSAELKVLEDGLATSPSIRSAVEAGSNATIEVRSGAGNPLGGRLESAGHLQIAGKGTAQLNVTSAGEVDVDSLTIGVSRTNVNNRADGNVSVSGFGSTVTVQGHLTAGANGDSHLTVTQSGIVSADSMVAAEERAGPLNETTSFIDVNNSGTLAVTNRFDLAERGKAELEISNAGFVTANELLAASELGSLAEINVTDPGSSMFVNSTIKFGPAGFAEATVQNQGFVTAPIIRLSNRGGAIAPIGSAFVLVTGDQSLMTASQELSIAGNGAGTLEIENDGAVESPLVLVGVNSPVNMDGTGQKGFLTLDRGVLRADRVDLLQTGTLQGNGNIDQLLNPLTVNNLRGRVVPGLEGIQVEGDYTQGAAASLIAELAGTAPGLEFGRLLLDGSALLDGTLDVDLIGGYTPTLGDTYEILSADGGVTGSFMNSLMPALPAGLGWRIHYNANDVTLEIGNAIPGDLDFDGVAGIADIDQLIAAIASGSRSLQFDLNGDGMLTLADRDVWLVDAGNANQGAPYLVSDSNLDGVVDGVDFLIWNAHKFTATGTWSQADWNADGISDGQDFLLWNNFKFSTSDGVQSVPEPNVTSMLAMGLLALLGTASGRKR